MPTGQATEQSQVEYYHYYRASQKRVQQWVQKTSQELEVGTVTAGRSSNLGLNNGDDSHEDAAERTSRSKTQRKGSRRRSPSSSKRQTHAQVDNSGSRETSSRSRSTRKKEKTKDVRSRKSYPSDGLAISSLIPFGVLILALTHPSVATLSFSATILLAGYFCMDYSKKESISEKL